MNALEITNNAISLIEENCIGCGLCVTGCPEKAMKLVRRKNWRIPEAKVSDIGMAILKERGKETEILPYIDPNADPLKDKV